MKYLLYIVLLTITVLSCKKKVTSNPEPVYEVTYENLREKLTPGANVDYFDLNVRAFGLLIPLNAIDQRYDIKNVDSFINKTYPVSYLFPDNVSNFGSATFMIQSIDTIATNSTGVPVNTTYYYENSTAGLAALGKRTDSFVLSSPSSNVIFTYPTQSVVYSEKIYEAKYPFAFDDEWSGNNITAVHNFFINAPDSGLINEPGEERHTIAYNNKVTTSGLLNLQGYGGSVPVLIIKETYTDRKEYFINGNPAPAVYLTAAGLTQNETTTTVSYAYFSPVLGFVGRSYQNSAGTAIEKAYFRKFF